MPSQENSKKAQPLYRKVQNNIIRQIQEGKWKENDKLPTETELGEQFGVSMGTIKKALSELEKGGYVRKVQGSGTYVSEVEKQDIVTSVDSILDNTFTRIRSMYACGYREIYRSFLKKMDVFYQKKAKIRILVIETASELHSVYRHFFDGYSRVDVSFSDMDTIVKQKDVLFHNYDYIFISREHYKEYRNVFWGCNVPVKVFILEVAHKTLAKLASFTGKEAVVLCESYHFLETVEMTADQMGNDASLRMISYEEAENRETLDTEAIIIPQSFSEDAPAKVQELVAKEKEEGKRIIEYVLKVDQGSLLYIQELLDKSQEVE